MTDDIAISFRNVWKSYPSYSHVTGGIKNVLFHMPSVIRELFRRRTVLEDVSFDIQKGECFGFIGRNGAGKSTTLGLIAGVLVQEQGEVCVNGRVSPLLELGAGFHPELTGRENIVLNGVLLGLTRAEVEAQAEEIIEFSDLGGFIDQPVRTYSSGMYAKLGFSVVSILKPEILLVDEVLAVGDLAFARKCEKKFEEFRKNRDVTIVMVSHTLSSVASLCDRAAWVENKKIRMIGPVGDVIKEYEAANAPKVQVPDTATFYPAHVAPGVEDLDCSSAPAEFFPKANGQFQDAQVRISFLSQDGTHSLGHWSIAPQPVSLRMEGEKPLLENSAGESFPFILEAEDTAVDMHHPLMLMLQAQSPDGALGTPCWLPLCTTAEARQNYLQEKQKKLAAAAGSGFPPHLWPGGKTVRIVSRNIMVNDAVGNFAVGMAATLIRYGIPARLYAYASCAGLAGIVSSIGDLEHDTEPDDIVFYHYSTEDEFLPLIVGLTCRRKILYYHNVTPSHWFREACPELADALDRARLQYPSFASFDAVAANSAFSLDDVLPYVKEDTPATVFPPSMSLDKLTSIPTEPVAIPDAAKIILWVGRAVPHKRPDMALRLFNELIRLRDDTAIVMVAGGRGDFPQLLRLLEERLEALPENMRKNVCMLEGLSAGQLAWLYRRASLFLCTSGHEGYCLPVREAMSFGLPVAAFPQPAVEETLAGQGTILHEDVCEAAHQLDELLSRAKSSSA